MSSLGNNLYHVLSNLLLHSIKVMIVYMQFSGCVSCHRIWLFFSQNTWARNTSKSSEAGSGFPAVKVNGPLQSDHLSILDKDDRNRDECQSQESEQRVPPPKT